MSQRLHIGKTQEEFYDCVLESADNAEEKLLTDWLAMSDGFYLGPWKIRIGDKSLFSQIEPIITGVFEALERKYPDACSFYEGERMLRHPTREKLDEWIWSSDSIQTI